MADPFTLAGLATGMSGAGGIFGAIGSLLSGGAKSGQYQYQSGMAQLNAKIAQQNADWARATGSIETAQYGVKAKQTAGAIVAHQGASNIDVNRGSTAEVQKSQHEVALIDQNQIRTNAAHRAYGFDVEATKYLAEANMYSSAASNAGFEGVIGAFGSILGGAGSVASKWYQSSYTGIGGSSGTDSSGNPYRTY